MDWSIFVHYAWLIPLGLAVGTYGTLIGAGGGFVLVPILLLLYPHDAPVVIASMSLAVVFFNAASGSLAYGRMGRIDFRAAAVFALAAAPGALLGALTTGFIPRRLFDAFLGGLMVLVAGYLGLRPESAAAHAEDVPNGGASDADAKPNGGMPSRKFVYSVGAALSGGIGYVAGLLGIGGGIVHVPALVHVLKFPVHRATATSHMILAVMALSGTVAHVAQGNFDHGGVRRTIALSIGVVVGAQLGAKLSQRLHGAWILRGLAIGLFVLGVRLAYISITM